jgi:hypothetical protein
MSRCNVYIIMGNPQKEIKLKKNKKKAVSNENDGLSDAAILNKWKLFKILHQETWNVSWYYNDSCATCRNWAIEKPEPRAYLNVPFTKVFSCKMKSRKGKYEFWESNRICKHFFPNDAITKFDWEKPGVNSHETLEKIFLPPINENERIDPIKALLMSLVDERRRKGKKCLIKR